MNEQSGALQNSEQNPDRFESDTQKIIHRHLANKDDVITEEDIRSVRIGLTPPEAESEEANEQENSNS